MGKKTVQGRNLEKGLNSPISVSSIDSHVTHLRVTLVKSVDLSELYLSTSLFNGAKFNYCLDL